MSAHPFARFNRLSGRERRLLVRATVLLSLASAAVGWLPFRWAMRFGTVGRALGRGVTVEEVVWAVEAASRRLPWRTMCIEKGLVVQRMLRTYGIGVVLHYGARHNQQTRKLEAHVWVTVDDREVIGGDEASGFAEVACFP